MSGLSCPRSGPSGPRVVWIIWGGVRVVWRVDQVVWGVIWMVWLVQGVVWVVQGVVWVVQGVVWVVQGVLWIVQGVLWVVKRVARVVLGVVWVIQGVVWVVQGVLWIVQWVVWVVQGVVWVRVLTIKSHSTIESVKSSKGVLEGVSQFSSPTHPVLTIYNDSRISLSFPEIRPQYWGNGLYIDTVWNSKNWRFWPCKIDYLCAAISPYCINQFSPNLHGSLSWHCWVIGQQGVLINCHGDSGTVHN